MSEHYSKGNNAREISNKLSEAFAEMDAEDDAFFAEIAAAKADGTFPEKHKQLMDDLNIPADNHVLRVRQDGEYK